MESRQVDEMKFSAKGKNKINCMEYLKDRISIF